jgi:hypothetical protein
MPWCTGLQVRPNDGGLNGAHPRSGTLLSGNPNPHDPALLGLHHPKNSDRIVVSNMILCRLGAPCGGCLFDLGGVRFPFTNHTK